MLIDEAFKNALRIAIELAGTQRELARKTGVKQPQLSKYLSGEIQHIEYDSLMKLEPNYNTKARLKRSWLESNKAMKSVAVL